MTRVTAPDGSAWTVRRRWYPWRRALSLRELWNTSSADDKPADADTEPDDSPQNPVVHAILVVLAACIWLVIQAGKAVLILLAVIIAVTLSTVDLVLQLLVMPFSLLTRAGRVTRWPVQIDRDKHHFRTEYACGFSAAGALRDDLAAQIQRGELQG
jgi:hypothetical protein